MRIKKHGKMFEKPEPIQTERFSCKECGCEFTCKDDEYYVDLGGADWYCGSGSITTTTYTLSSVIKDYLVCSCPECHKIVKKVRERKNEYWSTITTTPTYTVEDDKNKGFDKWTVTCCATGANDL